MDTLSQARRSWNMSRVRGKDTKPELMVRKLAHSIGLRFRLHPAGLPGKPDLVFPKHKLAIFVHGCFWHRHEGCHRATMPAARSEFWSKKFDANTARDALQAAGLQALGWRVDVIWECETKDASKIEHRLRELTS